jgi:hypothetical protein
MMLDYDMRGVPGYGSGQMALLPPKVNVSSRGLVPVNQQVFAIRLPCSGLESAEIKLSLKLNVTAPADSKYKDTVLVFKRNKICMKGEKEVNSFAVEDFASRNYSTTARFASTSLFSLISYKPCQAFLKYNSAICPPYSLRPGLRP